MKKYLSKEKPKNKQVIAFKANNSLYPEIGIFEKFDNGIEEIYVVANDDVEQLINVEWWCELPM